MGVVLKIIFSYLWSVCTEESVERAFNLLANESVSACPILEIWTISIFRGGNTNAHAYSHNTLVMRRVAWGVVLSGK